MKSLKVSPLLEYLKCRVPDGSRANRTALAISSLSMCTTLLCVRLLLSTDVYTLF